MKLSYAMHLKGVSRCFDDTIRIYRDAVGYLCTVVLNHWDEISGISGSKEQQRFVEKLVHQTSKNKPAYGFDLRFPKFPSYFRRSAITAATGAVSSYRANLENWKNSPEGRKPRFRVRRNVMPAFYNGNMFRRENGTFFLKVFKNNDWVWEQIRVRKSDADYLQKNFGDVQSSPVLEKINHGYRLRVSVEVHSDAPRFVKDEKVQTVIGVDLGVINDAVCSRIRYDGTVTGQKFISSPVEKDRKNHILTYINRVVCSRNRSRKNPRLWRFVRNYNHAIAINTARGIVDFAAESGAQVIVFEHLDLKGKKTRMQKISLWNKKEIQQRTAALAARYGIRVSYICAKNTSRLAFDGSGEVVRDGRNHSLCTFSTGKQYNCDLSASKNIGARYFLRNIRKSMDESAWLQLTAKVPEACKRTSCTLSTLIKISAVCA